MDRFKQEPMYELPPGEKKNPYFPKRLVHCFCQKMEKFYTVFLSILYRKKCFLHKRKVKTHGLTSLKNWDFSKGVVSPWIWSKN